MATIVDIKEYRNDFKPHDVARRPFHRINSPTYDLAVDLDSTAPRKKRADGLGKPCGCRGPEDMRVSTIVDILSNAIVDGLDTALKVLPGVNVIKGAIDAANEAIKNLTGKDFEGDAKKALAKFIAKTIEGGLFARFLRAIPAWVPVGRKGYARKFAYPDVPGSPEVDKEEEREIEGTLTRSYQIPVDIPHFQWAHFYHWAFHVKPIPGHSYLVGEGNIQVAVEAEQMSDDDLTPILDIYNRVSFRGPDDQGSIECLMDVGAFSNPPADMPAGTSPKQPGVMFHPDWPFWPTKGDHFWATGRWAYDCMRVGKLDENAKDEPDRMATQINPCKAIAVARYEGFKFTQNDASVPAVRFMFFATDRGGYIDFGKDTEIGLKDRDYEFIVDLPPLDTGISPYAVGHTPEFSLNTIMLRPRLLTELRFAPFIAKGDPVLASKVDFREIEPVVEILRPKDPTKRPSQVKVTVPLTSLPDPGAGGMACGFVLTLGWHDPAGVQAARIAKISVDFNRLQLFNHEDFTRFKLGVNGRWTCLQTGSGADEVQLGVRREDLFLPDDALLQISAHGTKRNGFGEMMEEDTQDERTLRVGGLINMSETTEAEIRQMIKDGKDIAGKFTNIGQVIDNDLAKELLDRAPDDLFGQRLPVVWKVDVDSDQKDKGEKGSRASAVAREMFVKPLPIFNIADRPLGWIDNADSVAFVVPDNVFNVESLLKQLDEQNISDHRIVMTARRIDQVGSGSNLAKWQNVRQTAFGTEEPNDYELRCRMVVSRLVPKPKN